MANDMGQNRSKDDLNQIHEDTQREARVQPGPGNTTNESDMKAAEGLSADPQVAENYEKALDIGANQQGEGRIA